MSARPARKKATTAPAVEFVAVKPVATIDLDADDGERFARAMRVAAVFACNDDARPVLTAIHAVSDGKGTLTIEATDSYRLVRLVLPKMKNNDDPLPAFDALIPAQWLTAQLPKRRRLTGYGVDVTDSTLTIRDTLEQTSATKRLIGAEHYPNIDKLIDQPEHVEGIAEMIAFNPRHLAATLKACEAWQPSSPVRVRSLDMLKPVRFDVVTTDGNMTALLMPVRVAS